MEENKNALVTTNDLVMEIGKLYVENLNSVKINQILNTTIKEREDMANKIVDNQNEVQKLRISNEQLKNNNQKLNQVIEQLRIENKELRNSMEKEKVKKEQSVTIAKKIKSKKKSKKVK